MRKILPLILLAFLSHTAHSQHKYSCSSDELAFAGNDLVSYFAGKVEKGTKEHSLEYDGLMLRFSTKENLAKFKKDPEKYLPKYGGWCATAVASNTFIQPDYNMFKIQEGQLLFFEVKAFYNGKTHWDRNPEANELVADKKYQSKFEK